MATGSFKRLPVNSDMQTEAQDLDVNNTSAFNFHVGQVSF